MLLLYEWWRKGLASRFNPFRKKPSIKPADKLCSVTFLYDVKGVYGAGNNKRDTVFAWIEEGATSHDCVTALFDPPGVGKGQCTVKDVLVMVIPTVEAKVK